MDVLSDAVSAMRVGRAHSGRVVPAVPFGRWFPAVDGAGFHVVLRGHCWLHPPDGPPVELGPGDVAFLARGSAHGLADGPTTALDGSGPPLSRLSADSGADRAAPVVLLCGAYLLDRSRAHPLLDELPDLLHLPTRVGRHPQLRAAVDLLGHELDRARPGADAMVPALLDILLLHVLRAWLADRIAAEPGTGWVAALADPAVAAALRAVHGEPGRAWTVEQLAAVAGLSRSAFARRFSGLVGRPPLSYLTWWRMTLAARALADGDAPLAAVARQVGYGSEFAFGHAFKRELGVAPGEFRRRAS